MCKYLPGNPTLVVQNVPGAGSVIQVNQLAEAKPDGLTLANVERGMATLQVLGGEGVRYDVTKLGWLGSVTQEAFFIVAHQRAGITKADDLKTKTLKIGQVTPGGFAHIMIIPFKEVLGYKIDNIFGYQGQSEVVLGIDRGEIDGVAISWSSIITQKRDQLADKTYIPLVAVGAETDDPLAANAVRGEVLFQNANEADKQLYNIMARPLTWSRAFAVPPNTDPKILTGMRQALMLTAADAEFKADADRQKFDVIPVDGDRVQQLIAEYANTPKSAFDRLNALVDADANRQQ
jgi:tripartite-type tricarboxylate transporter receptor subunit TctC